MTLFGTDGSASGGGGFQIGTTNQPQSDGFNQSLDDIMASRRKEASAATKKKKTPTVIKSVSNTDRSIATSRAKRQAAMASRRGMASSAKPSKMDVEMEVEKQTTASARKKQQQQKKKGASGKAVGTAPSAGNRRRTTTTGRQANAAKSKAVANTAAAKQQKQPFVKKPTKKAMKAAISAMKQAGFDVPKNMEMNISFTPKGAAANKPKKQPQQKQQQQQMSGGSGRGGRGGGNNSNRGGNSRGGGGRSGGNRGGSNRMNY